MLLLAIDTSGKDGSIALAQGEADGSCAVLEMAPLEGGAFSAQLIPQAAWLLAKHGFRRQDIAAFAAASGPGSFTGLRVGLAAIMGLAEVLVKPIAAVSILEAIAVAGAMSGKVVAVLDAGRSEVYAGEYQLGDEAALVSERLLTRDEFLASVERGELVVTPVAAIAEWARAAGLQVREIERPGSAAVARLGWKKILSGRIVPPEALDANYIRRGAAEISKLA